jgi:signal transduction histidine kinase/CheY-like chemotaxis protein
VIPLPKSLAEAKALRVPVLLALVAVYVAAGKFGLLFAFVHESASPVWPPTGLAIAAVLLLGRWVWPAVFVGAFLVNVTTAGSVASSLGIAAGNTLEALLAGYLVGRFASGPATFERPRDIFVFGVASFVSAAASASIGVASLVATGLASLAAAPRIAWTWWLGDLAGALIVTPAIVLWLRTRPLGFADRASETVLALASTALVGLVAFGELGARRPLAFICLPPLAWAAFRLRPREVATCLVLVAAVAVRGTVAGTGAFSHGDANESLLLLEAFMATISMTMLPVAAVVAQRQRIAEVRRRFQHERERLLLRERELRSQAEVASRAKDDFLAMLSHELRNPLAAATSAVHVLEATAGRARDPQQEEATAILGRQLRHLGRLLDDLLDVALVTSGGIALERGTTDLARAVQDGVDALRIAGRLDEHELTVEARPVWVGGDPARLEQVVTNLLANAVKYTPAGGRVSVRTEAEGTDAVLRVEDDGIGISAETLPFVFELFFQEERPLSRPQGGLGLGLTLVRRIVELHGGTVQASSAGPGKGAAFVVRLPAIPAPAAETVPAASATPAASEQARVLLVEDGADAREILRMVLERSGYAVTCAEDGPAGVAAALRCRPGAALVDVGLPGFDGYEVARRIRAAPGGASLLLVALTGYGQPADRRRAEEAGFDLHLVKPVDPAQLLALLAERLRQPNRGA